MEWQPIATAPKDETEFLVLMNQEGHRYIMVGAFEGEQLVDYHGHMCVTEEATHWMPLPELPTDCSPRP